MKKKLAIVLGIRPDVIRASIVLNKIRAQDKHEIVFIWSGQHGYGVCPEITLKAILAKGKVEYLPSGVRRDIETDFKLYKEGFGCLWLLIRGFAHRCGILWF